MTQPTVSLVEFLLVRIAEDEADLSDGYTSDHCDAMTGEHYSNERIRAECESKRRIIADIVPALGYAEEQVHERFGWQKDYADQLLRLLARVYADHPGYRQEWTP